MARQEASSGLPRPLRAPVSLLGKVPGAGTVGRAAGGALDAVGRVSPRGRRLAVYTGAGVLGVAGVVEWPVALTGAAVAWLTQARQREHGTEATGGTAAEAADEPGAGSAARTSAREAVGPERRSRGPEARRTTAGAMKSAAGGGIEARRSTAAARRPATGAPRRAAGDEDRPGDTAGDERSSGTAKSGTGAARSAARSARAAKSATGHAAGNPAGRLTSRAGRVRMASGTSRPAHDHDS